MSTKRQSNIELLRIISMLLIITHHYKSHGGWDNLPAYNSLFLNLFGCASRIGVNCFIMITGYFSFKSTDTKLKTLLLWKDRWIYSVIMGSVLALSGLVDINSEYIMTTFFPVLFNKHKFITTFLFMYLLIPFINKFITSLEEKEFRNFLLLFGAIISLLPTFIKPFANNNLSGSYLEWMFFMYCIGAYIKKYDIKLPQKINWNMLCAISVMSLLLYQLFIRKIYEVSTITTFYHLIALVASVCVFCMFVHLRMKYHPVINRLAAASFSVFLIHDDPSFREVLWKHLLRCPSYQQSNFLWLHAIISVAAVWLCCTLIGIAYNSTIGKLTTQWTCKYYKLVLHDKE